MLMQKKPVNCLMFPLRSQKLSFVESNQNAIPNANE